MKHAVPHLPLRTVPPSQSSSHDSYPPPRLPLKNPEAEPHAHAIHRWSQLQPPTSLCKEGGRFFSCSVESYWQLRLLFVIHPLLGHTHRLWRTPWESRVAKWGVAHRRAAWIRSSLAPLPRHRAREHHPRQPGMIRRRCVCVCEVEVSDSPPPPVLAYLCLCSRSACRPWPLQCTYRLYTPAHDISSLLCCYCCRPWCTPF